MLLYAAAFAQAPTSAPSGAPSEAAASPAAGSPAPGGAPSPDATASAGGTPAPASPPPGDVSALGVVVRLTAPALSGTVFVELVPEAGEATRVEVKDDGKVPDVGAGDGTWSGGFRAAGDSFSVRVLAGGETYEGGTVSWEAGRGERDLTLALDGANLTASAVHGGAMAGGAGPVTPAGGSAPTGTPPTGTPPTGAPSADPSAPAPVSQGPTVLPPSSSDATLYIALGVGALLLAGLGWAWLRGGGSPSLPRGVSRVPDLGIAGPGTPALSEGPSAWVAAEGDLPDLLRGLLLALAATRPVLVCAPAEQALPPGRGWPVYRVAARNPSTLGDVAEALVERHDQLAVVLLGEAAADPAKWIEDLPEGVGAVVVAGVAPAGLSAVTCRRHGDLWILTTPQGEVRAREELAGLYVV